jgi:hypothetical protein
MTASVLAMSPAPTASARVANGCHSGKVTSSARALAGNTVGTASTWGQWCVLGIVGNAKWLASTAETSTPGWHMSDRQHRGAGVVANSARIWSQYTMVLKTLWVQVQEKTLCPRVYGSVTGAVHASSGCTIY